MYCVLSFENQLLEVIVLNTLDLDFLRKVVEMPKLLFCIGEFLCYSAACNFLYVRGSERKGEEAM